MHSCEKQGIIILRSSFIQIPHTICEWDHLLAQYYSAILGINFGKEKFGDTHIERKAEIYKAQTP